MFTRIVLALFLAIVAYGIYSYVQIRQDNFINYGLADQRYEAAETQADAPLYPPRQISSGGPSTPNQLAEPGVRIASPETPYDPSDPGYESSAIPERLRHPETMFGPGLAPDSAATNQLIEDSGVAGKAAQQTSRSFTTFSPEFAQNGGSFLENGVTAFDSEIPSHYSTLD